MPQAPTFQQGGVSGHVTDQVTLFITNPLYNERKGVKENLSL
jgi:hypothetical protein